MVQEQLVEYIGVQIKTGISRDAIKASLVGAGWQAADVEDTLKKVESTTAKPVAVSSVTGPKMVTGTASSPIAKSAEPQIIKMSDLVSAAPASSVSKSSASSASPKIAAATQFSAPSGKNHMALIVYVIAGVLIVGLGALAGVLYSQNSALAAKVASLGGESAGVTTNLATLNAEVQALDASNTALTAQTASITSENQ